MKKENTKKVNVKKKKKLWLIPVIIVLVAAILSTSWNAYAQKYYHAWSDATDVIYHPDEGIEVYYDEDDNIVFTSENPQAGLIFYPGAKVEYTAYAPLMQECAKMGFFCVLVKMPQNMAIFDINAANDVRARYSDISEWYIGGHSMGGAMAAYHVDKYADEYEGLILLAAYSAADLSDTNLTVLSIYGSEDGVLQLEKYEKYKTENLPGMQNENETEGGTIEFVIEGGCHSYFGIYGEQKGDGTPTISNREQIETTADEIGQLLR